MWQTKPYLATIALQSLIEKSSKTADAKSLAMLARSFVSLEMLKLRLRMKPAPKPIDTTKLQPTAKRQRNAVIADNQDD